MAASQGNSGYGSIFYTGVAGSPPTYTAVLEIATIDQKALTVPAIDLTHLLSPNTTEEMTPGIIKPGTIDISGNFIGDSTQLNFLTLAQAQTVFPFKQTAPVQKGTKTLTVTGSCFVTEFASGPFEANKKIDFKASMQTTGTITYAVA